MNDCKHCEREPATTSWKGQKVCGLCILYLQGRLEEWRKASNELLKKRRESMLMNDKNK